MVSLSLLRIKALHRVLSICTIIFLIGDCQALENEEMGIKKSDFPSDFAFGVATSAGQIEGSADEGGRTPSVWDTYAATPGNIEDGSNVSVAIDSYKRYKEDIKYIKDLGTNYYRFSISWSRILPKGSLRGGVNKEGIDHYNSLIDELIKNGITPFVTILHFDTPQALEDRYGGFLNGSIVDDFKDYCELLFKTYGDRVKNWITINEPFVVALGYDLGKGPPGRCSLPPPIGPCKAGNSSTEPYIVGHNLIIAHARAAKLYKHKYQAKQGGQIGITLVGEFIEPLNPESPDDKAAAERYVDFLLGWFVEPLLFGDYPMTMRTIVQERLPTFTTKEKNLVKGSVDFIGLNYYTSRYGTKAKPMVPTHYLGDFLVKASVEKDGIPIGPKATGNDYIYSYPQGLQKLLEFMKQKYQNITIYITENGISEATVPDRHLDDYVNDDYRIMFIFQHLYYVNKAMKNGVNVKGYFYWSLFDSFEGRQGYTQRFGLYFIDYNDDYKCIPKKSAKWLHCFLKDNITQLTTLSEQTSMCASNATKDNNDSPSGALTTAAVAILGTLIGFFALFVLPTFCETEEDLRRSQIPYHH
ncbi:beta-glucosidase 24-like isoform X2 [Humulus lupulus]|uniref:beta-glucosidase 24-like isoform X2 n=1 Tax=Humulus lupulus TaxID=3486 RepID=UPI002B4096A7|nr:beta-glucosidase 24-like isoform X2 [Humulus lupulus]